MNEIPISTKWVLDAAGEVGRTAIKSVYIIICLRTSSKGTGFLLENGHIITNEHVIRGCNAAEVLAQSPFDEKITFSKILIDAERDLAILTPSRKLEGGLVLNSDGDLDVGTIVSTWGFPLGYNGPAPLLSVGYLAGFMDYSIGAKILKHLIVNGAFNPGNSGGPLFKSNDNKVIGVVVSKHAPISKFHVSALKALAEIDQALCLQELMIKAIQKNLPNPKSLLTYSSTSGI
jgi:S1-C subfamily serine protease